jgi:ribonuclease Z
VPAAIVSCMARRVLAARGRMLGAGAPPLLVIGPRPLRPVLAAQAALEPLPFTFVDCASTEAGAPDAGCGGAAVSAALAAAELASLTSVRVVHCAHAFGVVLVGRAGWKLAFSGDTRPCDALVRRARAPAPRDAREA